MRQVSRLLLLVMCLTLGREMWAASNQTAQQALKINVVAGLSITTTTLPGGVAGQAYPSTQLTAAGGATPYTWAVLTPKPGETGLPKGLTLSSGGVLSGTVDPTACTSGTCAFTFTVQVTDSTGLLGQVKVNAKFKAGL